METTLKYSWQQTLLDAYVEFRPQFLLDKIKVAERAIVERLRDLQQPDIDERSALHDALHALRALLTSRDREATEDDKNVFFCL